MVVALNYGTGNISNRLNHIEDIFLKLNVALCPSDFNEVFTLIEKKGENIQLSYQEFALYQIYKQDDQFKTIQEKTQAVTKVQQWIRKLFLLRLQKLRRLNDASHNQQQSLCMKIRNLFINFTHSKVTYLVLITLVIEQTQKN